MRKFVLNKNNYVLLPFLALLIILSFIYPSNIKDYMDFVDWNTIAALIGLLITTTAIKESLFFVKLAERVISKIKNERQLAIALITLSAFLSMIFTNDIALFIVVPLTLAFQSHLKNNIQRLVIFEAIAVNVGAALTPIGSPQNLFLWHQWNISFISFIIIMFPLFMLLFLMLVIFSFLTFPPENLTIKESTKGTVLDKKLFYISFLLLLFCIVAVEQNFLYVALIIVFLIYFFVYQNILLKVDWLLIILFIVMFIDFHVVSLIPFVLDFITQFNLHNSQTVYSLSLLSTQIFSNVPASIFLSKFSNDWYAIAYGVNIGGNGFIIGSLANIIALRFINTKKIWIDFHKYSLPYFIVTGFIVYWIFF